MSDHWNKYTGKSCSGSFFVSHLTSATKADIWSSTALRDCQEYAHFYDWDSNVFGHDQYIINPEILKDVLDLDQTSKDDHSMLSSVFELQWLCGQ